MPLALPTLARLALLFALGVAAVAPAGAQRRPAPPPPPAPPAPPLYLIPQPREAAPGAVRSLAGGIAIVSSADLEDRDALVEFGEAMRDRGIAVHPAGTAGALVVRIHRLTTSAARQLLAAERLAFDTAMNAEGYALVVRPGRATVVSASAAGGFYGLQTLKQLVDGSGRAAAIHEAAIRDWPALRWRGVHDDLSRGPVPTLEFQEKQIRTFAAYKLNVYSPYFEHTLQYGSNLLVAPPGGAVTPAQVKELVAYARRYHVTIVPEQEAFGHLHHLLKYELYAPLAETAHGHVLAPDQAGAMELIRQMFAEIDTLFPGPFVHLGADETFELGRGQTKPRVAREGIGPVYLGFISSIERALHTPRDSAAGRRYLFWGDIAVNHPDLVKTLPKDLVPVAWEYDPHPTFDSLVVPYRRAGLETWIAPGVNNWNRVWPNYDIALRNIQGFVRDGQRLGATGMLNTTWDDDGEALFNQTWYGILFGATAAWQPGAASIPDFQARFGRVFHGDTTGAIDLAQRKLILAHQLIDTVGAGDANDYLFWLDPYSVDGQRALQTLRPVLHDVRIAAESAIVLATRVRPTVARERDAVDALLLGARRIDFLGMKFQFADEMQQMYARAAAADTTRAGRSAAGHELSDITSMNGRMQDLRDGYALIRELYQEAWLRENRPYWLTNVLARYDQAMELWVERGDRAAAARRAWSRTRMFPPPEALGLPPAPPPAVSATPPTGPASVDATAPAASKPPR